MNIIQSQIRLQALSTMLRTSPTAIVPLLLVSCPHVLCISNVVGSEWLGVMAGNYSRFKTFGEQERILGVRRFSSVKNYSVSDIALFCPDALEVESVSLLSCVF